MEKYLVIVLLVILVWILCRRRIASYVSTFMEDIGFYRNGFDPDVNAQPENLIAENSKAEDRKDVIFLAAVLLWFGLGSLFKKAVSYFRLRR